ncbi:MAG TPA: tRNA (N(6)-L-threonylcarbamoyladenosine(37)-C(2))-methylthiotransferase MtaB, partial [Chlamydiales bacterium]|nr:tRNA (N(6)-L-threonylcarbamoyladenosine(37)-C(2))-methylthiotransferase MtaB [Chlamydiales bacterium]
MTLKKKFKITTLGCRTNQYESQGYLDQLKGMGFVLAAEDEKADLCVVNTCTVTAEADKSSKAKIRQLLRDNPEGKVVVTGCLVENSEKVRDDLLGLSPNVQIVRNLEKEELVAQVFPEEEVLEFLISGFEAHTRAFVKVQDGCNSFCTYCIIPYTRGRSRSRPVPEILDEIRGLVKNGYKEVVLTGINIGDFDGGGGARLHELVREVDQIDCLERIRISSIDPDEVDDDLAASVLQSKKTCPSMHVVLQSGSNVVLKRMNRKYTQQMFLDCVEKMKKANPDFTFTTDVIVGFPGETDRDFQDTLDLVEQVQFAKVHMFPYSDRPRTRACNYPNKVPPEVMRERKEKLLMAADRAAFRLRQNFVGRTMKVLTEETGIGHTENFLKVKLMQDIPRNEIKEVYLKENTEEGF